MIRQGDARSEWRITAADDLTELLQAATDADRPSENPHF